MASSPRRPGRTALLPAAMATLLLAEAAHAQSTVTLPAIDVTGVAENAWPQVPAAVTVVPRDTVEQAGVESVRDLAPLLPNTYLSNQGSPRFSINTMRGIGNTIRNDYFNSTIGVYVDGVALPSAEFSRRLVDVESIEVQRGPNGTSQGRFSLGGSIHVRTRQPTDTLAGEIEATYGDNGQAGGGISLSGPLVPGTVYGRGYFDYITRNGFINDATGGDIDGLETFSGGASVRFQRDPSFSATLSFDAQQDHVGAYAFLPYDDYRRRSLLIDPENDERRRSRGVTGTLEWDLGPARLTSITAWRSYDVTARQDLAYSPMVAAMGGGRTYSVETGWQFSEELRLSSPREQGAFRWTAGLYYQRDRVDYTYDFDMPAFGGVSRSASRYDRDEVAGFGEATATLGAGFELTAGLRLSLNRDEMDNNNPFSGTTDAVLATPRVQLAWRADADRMLYASVTRGARSGGFSRLSSDPAEYKPEYLTQYEVGLRSYWLDRKLAVNASLFRIDWDDQQITQLVGTNQTRTTNAGKSHSQGLELEAAVYPMPGLEVSGRLGLIKAEYDEYVNASGADLSGKKMVNTPSTTVGASVQYRTPLGGLPVSFVARGDYHLVGSHYFDPENSLRQDSYSLANLRIGVENERFSAAVFVRNLLDTRYRAYGFTDSFGYDVAIAGERRLVGANLKLRF
jgi:outer membrane receptor protein involved in Fe transport